MFPLSSALLYRLFFYLSVKNWLKNLFMNFSLAINDKILPFRKTDTDVDHYFIVTG